MKASLRANDAMAFLITEESSQWKLEDTVIANYEEYEVLVLQSKLKFCCLSSLRL